MDRKKLIAGAATALALTLGAGTVVAAQQGTASSQQEKTDITAAATASQENEAREGNDSDKSLTGSPAKKAADAALQATGGGTLLEVEKGDDPGAAYEVEIRKTDGSVAEVMVDDKFSVIDQVAGD